VPVRAGQAGGALARIGITTGRRVCDGRHFEAVDRAYVDAVALAGGLPVLVPILDPSAADAALIGLDGLVLSGGGDVDPLRYGEAAVAEVWGVDPTRDAWELALVASALRDDLGVLAICRGCQVLAVASGGSLVQHLPTVSDQAHSVEDRHAEPVHEVRIDPGSTLSRIVGAADLAVNTMHHQAVGRLGDGLQAVAWADDGVVEAVEMPARRVIGVQWHPEHLPDRAEHRALFDWLVAGPV
jgi:gamma-glutamyl-gamma-aminobutyrate hydrolase PuuD